MSAALLLVSMSALAAPPRAQKIVDRWLQGKSLRGLTVGVHIVDTADGSVWGAHEADTRLNPASGTKLLTTAAALHLLPMHPAWKTRVYGVLQGDAMVGPLRLAGSGDPKLLVAQLESLADALAATGVRSIPAGVIVHAGHFDAAGLPPAYEQKQSDAGYRPRVGAAAANFAAVRVVVSPGKRRGSPTRVSVEGGVEAVELIVSARTVSGAGQSVSIRAVQAADGRTQILVSGQLGLRAAPYDARKRLFDPDLWTGLVLRTLLRARGVVVGEKVSVSTAPLPGGSGPVLGAVESASLPQTLADVNTWSNNFMAETVLKQMGCDPKVACSWALATRRVTDALTTLGLPPAEFDYVNGSGLYKATTVSASAMTTLLTRMVADPVRGPAFVGSLAVSGKPGTLQRRLTDRWTRGKVKGKTGTLDEVVSLSGYVPSRSGRALAFSVLVNEATPERTAAIRRKIDRLVRLLAKL